MPSRPSGAAKQKKGEGEQGREAGPQQRGIPTERDGNGAGAGS
jgi:hypothetical protein